MPDQYQNFTNPTIVPDKPIGWQSAQQGVGGAISSIGDIFKQRYQAQQALQLAIAQEAAKSQFDVWSKMQDPIARALTMGKLGEMGFPVGQMNGAMGGNVPSMAQMLQGNQFANMVPQWGQGQPSSVTPSPSSPGLNIPGISGSQGANFNNFNPVQGGQSQGTPSQGNFV
ncbi:MAG: hypothetical protein V4440_03825, partial [Pseudomonadota bacterium]